MGDPLVVWEHEGTFPGFPVEVVDTTGAGEAFVAEFIRN
jgi:sugar/nucleoside kinase (ribokinase family)